MLGFLVSLPASAQFDHPVALSAQIIGDDQASRVIIDFDRKVDVSPQLLQHPWRLVLDFERLGFGFDPDVEKWSGFGADMRWGDMSEANSRIIFEMDTPFRIVKTDFVENKQAQTHRLIIDLAKTDAQSFQTAMLDRIRTSAVVRRETKSNRLGKSEQRVGDAQFVVVIDPGHGGIDPGAIGRSKTLEKNITLSFAKQLQNELQSQFGIKAILTRREDVFVKLNDRVQFARQSEADLFISIHADSVRQKYVRGATVYTISDKASDDVSAQLAESANRSDEIAGINFDDEQEEVADILVDLARRETHGFSIQFARLAVSELSQATKMIKNPHRHAGFRVLRAPDVPSVLIELGYLSNDEDEKLLKQTQWRANMAKQIGVAVERFAQLSGREIAQNGSE